MLKNTARVLSVSGLMAISFASFATTYPLTVTDLDGQKLTFTKAPQRIILQDGRDILSLAVLDKANPFQHVVAWNNLLKKTDSGTWDMLKSKWPDSAKILDMGFSDKGQVDLETVIAQKPDLMVAQLRAKDSLKEAGVLDKLSALKIPVLFVDYERDPAKNTAPSIELLGKVLNQEDNARAYSTFYQQHYQHIQQVVASVNPKPKVFIEAIAGRSDSCCFTHGDSGWGKLVQAVGADNIGTDLLPGASGDVSLEKVISMKPDAYIMTGSARPSNGSVSHILPLGYGADQASVDREGLALLSRNGISQISAVTDKRAYGVYHQFYDHPYNIVGMEYLAKFIYPQQFKDLDPAKTYHDLVRNYTQLPDTAFIFGWSEAK
ncbi:ABC transporter substrate-binding protein [Hafnia psychrotolerans]|jgi:iron complex transport system substrate-binding protein|uniref:ABC transporter substrate-binding protein n=1 Tax=Hafnia psychrotolerans TaxID=1477018 RepID=A0ABQ1FVE9_9GAMM|nr:ABC transporter substrate-binding protein [Hafnia psychrotolerans]GGA30820.1 ABC transporter substrate-binding protein [Hafnia psychrotolerans]